jgi:8-hydroxy-5-deazaflavin:NADPH oxidoreductase
MKIGFIGAGTVAQTLARHITGAGHQVWLSNSRGLETLSDIVAKLGPLAKAVTKEDVLEADIVVLATHFIQAPQALEGLKWRGQILIDATNAHSTSPAELSPAGVKRSLEALKGRTSSEIVADLVPGARLVKAISNMPMRWIGDFSKDKAKTVIFVSGDDQAAKDKVVSLLEEIGFAGIDLGSLRTGGALQQLGGPLSAINLHLVGRLR